MIVRPPPTRWEQLWADTERVLPLLIANALILTIALVRWRRAPCASALAASGAGLALLWMSAYLTLRQLPIDAYSLRGVYRIVNGWALWAFPLFHSMIGFAVFVGRPKRSQ